jgi:ATP/maltotriose-dependent transcriptional regulator MalT
VALALAKLARPRLEAVCPRPRLFKHLDDLAARGVAWVEGPPGAGKTTVVASWLEARRRRALWYRVDEADGDVATFFHDLELVARGIARGRTAWPRYQPDAALDLSAFARHWFRSFYANLGVPLTLVLDDYHDAPAALHPVVRAAFTEQPDCASAVVLSRAGHPDAFARLRMEGKLRRLAPEELLLTPEESRAIVRVRARSKTRSADALHACCGGWAAGLTLLLAAERDGTAGPRPVDGFRDVFQYFAGEVLERSDAATRTVLLETALLPQVSAAAACTVTGIPRAERILADLAHGGYFTTRDAGGAVYRYHPLFREFLLERAGQELPPARLVEVRMAAARLLAASGAIPEAAALLRDAGAHAELGTLLEERAGQLLDEGRAATLRDFLLGLPPEAMGSRPWLSYWLGMSWMGQNQGDARRALERARDAFLARADAAGAYLACAALLDSYVYDWTEFRPLEHELAAFEELRRRWPEFPSEEVAARVACSVYGALLSIRPDDPSLAGWQERVEALAASATDPSVRVHATMALAHFAAWRGDVAVAQRTLAPLRGAAQGRDSGLDIGWRVQAARAAATSGDGEGALALADEALAIAGATGNHWWDQGAWLLGAWGATIVGEASRARGYLEAFERQYDPTLLGYLEQVRGLVLYRAGDVEQARARLAISLSFCEEHAALYPASWNHVALAAVARASGDDASLSRHLADAERLAARTGSHIVRYWSLLLRAATCGDGGEATRLAGEALRESREHGPFDAMWIDLEVLARACVLALDAGVEAEEARALVARWRLPPPTDDACDAWPWPLMVRTLGAFRLERSGTAGPAPKAQARPVQLLKALVALGGAEVPEWKLTDALWPDAEADAAQHALEMNLSRLRALLGQREAVLQRDRKLTLDTRVCWVDALALERWLARARPPRSPEEARRDARRLLAYGGAFLADEDAAWVRPARDRLRRRVRGFGEAVAAALVRGGDPDAGALLGELTRRDPELSGRRVGSASGAVE